MIKIPTDLMLEWCYFEDGKYKLKEGAPEQARKDLSVSFRGEIRSWKEAMEESRKVFDKRTKR